MSLNVTATNGVGDGFVTVYACGAREAVSSANFTNGATVANAVIAPVSATGTICLFAMTDTDLVVDINGLVCRTTELDRSLRSDVAVSSTRKG